MRGLVIFLCVAVGAQERRPAFGTVTAEGKVVAGAAVVCVGAPWFGEVEGPTDVVEVVTDERGRFVVRLLPDRGYEVHAATELAGAVRCSPLADLVCGGTAGLALGAALLAQHLQMTGEERWREFAPLRFEVAPRSRHAAWMALDEDRLLPAMPRPLQFRVRSREGVLLGDRLPWFGSGYDTTIELPEIHPLALRVLDATGARVAGAELWQEFARERMSVVTASWIQESLRPALQRVGVTGADGTAELRLPVPLVAGKVASKLVVQVRAPGHAQVCAGVLFQGPPFVNTAGIRVPADNVLPVTVEPDLALVVDPPRACSVLLVAEQMQGPQRCETHVRATTDERGRGRVPLQLGRDILAAYARVDVAGEPPLWSVVTCDGKTVTVPLAARRFDVQVTSADGGLPRGARCVAIPQTRFHELPDVPLPLDAAGRGSIRLGPGNWLLLAEGGGGAALREIEAGTEGTSCTLALKPLPAFTLRVTNGNGDPLPGRRVSFGTSHEGGSRTWYQLHFRRRVTHYWHALEREGTDADGCILLPLPPDGQRTRVKLWPPPPSDVTVEVIPP